MSKKNLFYAQSGGATAVINASACGVIETARKYAEIGSVYAGLNGILGALKEELIDTNQESPEAIAGLRHTPACAFGTCRYQLKNLDQDDTQYRRLIEVFATHQISYFLYNGGGDSQDTAHKVSKMSQTLGYPLTCIGIPKTIDNDLPFTDNSPGFGSVAKYIAVSIAETALDVACMASTSTKVFILEVMGRHAGWIAAAAGLASQYSGDAPHIILFPEIAFHQEKFLQKVQQAVNEYGYCVIAASEGIRNETGQFLSSSGLVDAFGHAQLGGVAPVLANLIKQKLGYKYHWAVADYLQRAARHVASQTDVDQAYQLGKTAVEYALCGQNNVMLTIQRESDAPYRWQIGSVPLEKVAKAEFKLPPHYITEDGFGITTECRRYLQPLIQGEAYPPYKNGLPQYVKLQNNLVKKKLDTLFEIA